LAKEITQLVEEIRALGPLNWPERLAQSSNGAVHTPVTEEVTA
jgi:hypothetical protein